MEVVVAAMVLAVTVVAASAVFPLSHFLQDRSGGYSRAATMLQRKLEQVKSVDPPQLTYSGLRSAGVIDPAAAGSNVYTFTSCDQVAGQLLQGQGTMTVTGSGTDLVRVDVAVTWIGSRGMTNRCAAMTYIADKSVWREP